VTFIPSPELTPAEAFDTLFEAARNDWKTQTLDKLVVAGDRRKVAGTSRSAL
jgi:hypothetical protein